MNQQPSTNTPRYRWLTNMAGCYLILWFLILIAALLVYKPFQGLMGGSDETGPKANPTPRILVHRPMFEYAVRLDDFSYENRRWELSQPYGRLEMHEGKLVLQSKMDEQYLMAVSPEFDLSGRTYYVQADLVSDIGQAGRFGLVFGFNRSVDTYYLFEISGQDENCRLLKVNPGKEEELVAVETTALYSYPLVNTLSVYFDNGSIELYLNGKQVSQFIDNEYLKPASVGVFVYDSGYRLIVDNFFAYVEE